MGLEITDHLDVYSACLPWYDTLCMPSSIDKHDIVLQDIRVSQFHFMLGKSIHNNLCVGKKFITEMHHVCDVHRAVCQWLMVLLTETIHSVNHISSLQNGEITEPSFFLLSWWLHCVFKVFSLNLYCKWSYFITSSCYTSNHDVLLSFPFVILSFCVGM